jgi:rod shape-determining protein MreC
MRALLQLLFQRGGFITFVLVESFCFYLIVNFNDKPQAVWENSYGILAGNLLDQRRKMVRYNDLPEILDSVMWENAALKAELMNRRTLQIHQLDTSYEVHTDSVKGTRSTPLFSVIPGEIINTTTHKSNNWVVINRGRADGVALNTAVISQKGVVGIVRQVDEHYCLAMSVLHKQMKLSASLRGQLGSMNWQGKDAAIMQLNDIPKDIEPQIGDTVYTSGYSSMFPKQYPIGRVVEKELPRGSNFYSIKVKLSQDPGHIDPVFIVKNLLYAKIDSSLTKASNQ